MTVQILILTHDPIGDALLKAASHTLGTLSLVFHVDVVGSSCDPQQWVKKWQPIVRQLGTNDGLLILTDLYGSTPYNTALKLNDHKQVKIVTGLNLSMLLKINNYPDLDIAALAQKAFEGGREGIILQDDKPPC